MWVHLHCPHTRWQYDFYAPDNLLCTRREDRTFSVMLELLVHLWSHPWHRLVFIAEHIKKSAHYVDPFSLPAALVVATTDSGP